MVIEYNLAAFLTVAAVRAARPWFRACTRLVPLGDDGI